MGFSHKHRFQKKYGLDYIWKMNLNDIAQYSQIPLLELTDVYNEHLEKTKSPKQSLLAVYNYCNQGSIWKEKNRNKNINE